ncbi:uncharacterized protein [Scyliorhinus torazame]|uniref:uncharacterized protein isoform X2 n=1 Tax=Scyliorhinus torazame TaxID=75743 RepID=UPI003B5C4BD5
MICNTYLGLHVVPVPYLVDAERYDLLNVLLERSESLGSQLLRRKSFFPLGSLKEIVANISQENFEVMEQNIQSTSLSPNEFNHEEVVIDEGVLKSIKLVVKDVNKAVSLFIVNPGTLKLMHNLPWIYSVRNVYIIYEVFYTTNIQLLVSDSKQTQEFRSKSRIPIGFLCKKFKLSSGGIIGSEVPLKKSLVKENFVNTSSYIYEAVVGKHFVTSVHQLPQRNYKSTSLFRSILPDCCFSGNDDISSGWVAPVSSSHPSLLLHTAFGGSLGQLAASLALLPLESSDVDIEMNDKKLHQWPEGAPCYSSKKSMGTKQPVCKMSRFLLTPPTPQATKSVLSLMSADAPLPLSVMGRSESSILHNDFPDADSVEPPVRHSPNTPYAVAGSVNSLQSVTGSLPFSTAIKDSTSLQSAMTSASQQPSVDNFYDVSSLEQPSVIDSPQEQSSVTGSAHEWPSVADSPREQLLVIESPGEQPTVANSLHEQLSVTDSPPERSSTVGSTRKKLPVADHHHERLLIMKSVRMPIRKYPHEGLSVKHERSLVANPPYAQVSIRHLSRKQLSVNYFSREQTSSDSPREQTSISDSPREQPSIIDSSGELPSAADSPNECLSDSKSSHEQLSVRQPSRTRLSDSESSHKQLSVRQRSRTRLSDSESSHKQLSVRQRSRTRLSDSESSHKQLSVRQRSRTRLSDSESPHEQLSVRQPSCTCLSDIMSSRELLSMRQPSRKHLSDSESPHKQLSVRQSAPALLSDIMTSRERLSDRQSGRSHLPGSESPHARLSVRQSDKAQQQIKFSPHEQLSARYSSFARPSDSAYPHTWPSGKISPYRQTDAVADSLEPSDLIPTIRDFVYLLQMILSSPRQLHAIMHSPCSLPSDQESPTLISSLTNSQSARAGSTETDLKMPSTSLPQAVTCYSETEKDTCLLCNSLHISAFSKEDATHPSVPELLPSLPTTCCSEVNWEQPSRSPSPDTSTSSELDLDKIHKSLSEMLMTSSDSESDETLANSCPPQVSPIMNHNFPLLVTNNKESKSLLEEKSLHFSTAIKANKSPCIPRSATYRLSARSSVMETPCQLLSAVDSRSQLHSVMDSLSTRPKNTETQQKMPSGTLHQTVTWYDENICPLYQSHRTSHFSEVNVEQSSVSDLLPPLSVGCCPEVEWDRQPRSSSPSITCKSDPELAKIYNTLSQVLMTSSDSECEETLTKFSS